MPTKTRIDPDGVYVCKESFGGNGFGVGFGERLPGSHELVQRYPGMFQPDGEILERPDDLRQATPYEAAHYAEHVERHKSVALNPADVVECYRAFSLTEASPADAKRLGLARIEIPAGARFTRFDPIVQMPQFADNFRAVG